MNLRSPSWRLFLFGCAALLPGINTHANNISVSSGSLTGNTGTQIFVEFDVSWQNSWRLGQPGQESWDAAWVFIKFRTASGNWQHAKLEHTGHVAPTGTTITTGSVDPNSGNDINTNPGVGVFVYRSVGGGGPFTVNNAKVLWNYSASGVAISEVTEVKVLALEMVYVPGGPFAAGSGGSENDAFILTTIDSGDPTAAPTGAGSLGGQAGGYPTGETAPSTFLWPNGVFPYYCMKYEVSQQGYVDFLNTLTYAQQATRTNTAPNSAAGTGAMSSTNAWRNGIDIQTPGVASTIPAVYACNLDGNTLYGESVDGGDIACNFLQWGDLTAYLDWCGLRPMTEMEFEKACRGPQAPVANEYPWGTTTVSTNLYNLENAGSGNEGVANNYSTTVGNALYSNTNGPFQGPVRTGIFAGNALNTGRISSGASYYGIQELGGNLVEYTVTIDNAAGRAFTFVNGNGLLDANGHADAPTWPSGITGVGAGARGSSFLGSAEEMRVSDRSTTTDPFGAGGPAGGLRGGGRGVRIGF